MLSKLALVLVPVVTLGLGALTIRSSQTPVPVEGVQTIPPDTLLVQRSNPVKGRPNPATAYRYRTMRSGYRDASFPYRDPRYNAFNPGTYRYGGYTYTSYRPGYSRGSYIYSSRYSTYGNYIYSPRYSSYGRYIYSSRYSGPGSPSRGRIYRYGGAR